MDLSSKEIGTSGTHPSEDSAAVISAIEEMLGKTSEGTHHPTIGSEADAKTSSNPFPFLKMGRFHGSMTRHACNGHLNIQFVQPNVETGKPGAWVAYIKFRHTFPHKGYVNSGLTSQQRKYIDDNPDLLPAAICSNLRGRGATSELKQRAIYTYWFQQKQDTWRHESDQIQSMLKVLASAKGVEVVAMKEIEGIEAYAFMCTSMMEDVGRIGKIDEVVTDATCKHQVILYWVHGMMFHSHLIT